MIRHSALPDRWLHISLGRRRFGTGRAAIVLLAAIGLIAGATGMSIGGKAAGAATVTWSIPVQIPVVGIGNGTNQLKFISCLDATDCTAFGSDGAVAPFSINETAGVWGQPTQINSTMGFNSVSCTAIGDCTAVGEYDLTASYETEINGVWNVPQEDLGGPVVGPYSLFQGVSCTGPGDCTAVGYGSPGLGGAGSQFATETNGVWSAPKGVGGHTGTLVSVSCVDATDCTAVGTLGPFMPGQVQAYDTETNGIWGPLTAFPGSPAISGRESVSCTAVGDCTAVGEDAALQPIYIAETNGTWGPITEVPGSLGGSGSFSDVSCTDSSDCTAVGTDGNGQPTYATETNGAWGSVTEVLDATGGSGSFAAVSCTDATNCTAVGKDGDNQPIYATSQPTSTTAVLIPANGARVSGTTFLDASATNATKVEFLLSGSAHGTSGQTLKDVVCTATPTLYGWLCPWNTTTVPNGSYDLVSIAFDGTESAFSSAVSFTVKN